MAEIYVKFNFVPVWMTIGLIKCFEFPFPLPNSYATDFFKYILAGAAVLAIIQVAIQ